MTQSAKLASLGTSNGTSVIVSGTAVASTSGTSIDFTGIPAWAKRITVMFNGVSTNGSNLVQIQLGAGSITTTGYVSTATNLQNGGSVSLAVTSTGIGVYQNNAGEATSGAIVLTLFGSNTWVASGNVSCITVLNILMSSAGMVTLSGILDRIRVTTVGGTDAFDAGSINILYE